jgi:probable O-glycosylation ligase (exosortase A-associated)
MIAIGASIALFYPWLGILAWTMISIMNPHRYAWSASELPVAAAVAIATLAGILISRDRIRITVTPMVVVFIAFALWMCFTLPSAIYYPGSLATWKQVMKIDFMILVATLVLHTRRHVMGLAWVLVGSIGIYGVKGGIFVVATGGNYRVWGPPESFIEGNNELALALVMTIPLMRFLQMQYKSFWVRHGFSAAMLLSATAALGTHSRGALLAIVAMAIVLWTRTRQKIVSGTLLVIIGASLIAFMPGQWDNRMESILRYERDESAQGRINAWKMAWNLASDRFLGGSYDIYRRTVFAQYAPDPEDIHAAHSIYFQVLGEHGFVGLALFLLLWFLVWRSAGWLRRNGLKRPESKWTSDMGSMIQASIAGYAIGGAFLSLAYFDLPYNLLLLVLITRRWVEEKGWESERVPTAGTARVPPLPAHSRS